MSFFGTASGGGSLAYKTTVRAASTALDGNIPLSGATPLQVDNVTLIDKDRVLLKNQALGQNNGIYVVTISGGTYTLTRATDANNQPEIIPNMLIPVSEGQTNGDKVFQLSTNAPIVLGTTVLTFVLGATTDHGDLSGLADDDHLQYHTDARAETWLSTKGTTTVLNENAVDVDFRVEGVSDPNALFVDASTNRIGIGSNSPNAKLQVNNSGTQLGFSVYSTSSNNTAELYNQGTTNYTLALNSAANSALTGASIGGYFARGTLSSRTQTLSQDSLFSISASGHTGSAFAGISAAVVLGADENTTASAYGGQIVFATTPNSTPGGFPLPRVYIKNDGKVLISGLTASELIATDSSKNLQSLSVSTYPSLTEISYVKGVTSAIQTQLNGKEPTITAGTTAQYYRGDKTFQTLNGLAVANTPAGNISSTTVQAAINELDSEKEPNIVAGTTAQYYRGDKSFQTLDKAAVGLANVDNTSDVNKPISTATQNALNLKADLVGGKIPSNQLPAIAITDTSVVNSQVQMLALTAQTGDVAVRTDLSKSFILAAEPASTLANWQELLTPADAVTSVNGYTGVVVLSKSDVGLGNVANIDQTNASNISSGTLGESYLPTGINANKIADGSVSSTEFQYLANVSSDIQSQLNGKEGTLTKGDLTSSDISVTGGTGAVIGSGVSLSITKGNLSEVTSSVLTITGGTSSVFGSGTSIEVKAASASQSGYLSSTKFSEFDAKQPAGSYITALTGEVTASGPGSVAATISANAVTNAKLAQVATATFKGRTTAGTGNVEDLTSAQATALLDVMGANSGSGAIKGLVPASGAGDQAKFLRADATWVTVDLSIIPSVHAQTGTVNVSSSAYYVGVDSSSGAVTVNLPAAVLGKKLVIKDEGGQCSQALKSISIVPASGTIDGAANYSMIVNYEALTLVSNGTNWFII